MPNQGVRWPGASHAADRRRRQQPELAYCPVAGERFFWNRRRVGVEQTHLARLMGDTQEK
jgi:hypothetical protein